MNQICKLPLDSDLLNRNSNTQPFTVKSAKAQLWSTQSEVPTLEFKNMIGKAKITVISIAT
jgi:hypothetical protein